MVIGGTFFTDSESPWSTLSNKHKNRPPITTRFFAILRCLKNLHEIDNLTIPSNAVRAIDMSRFGALVHSRYFIILTMNFKHIDINKGLAITAHKKLTSI